MEAGKRRGLVSALLTSRVHKSLRRASFFPPGYSATNSFIGVETYYSTFFAAGTVSDARARQLQFFDNLPSYEAPMN